MSTPRLALAHDYFTQRGGAERVAIELARVFPDAPFYTTLVSYPDTFPEVLDMHLTTSCLDSVKLLKRHHRLALPVLASAVSRTSIDADVVLASSSGWAHGYRTDGRMIVYCHTPARWLYQFEQYVRADSQISAHAALRRVSAAVAATALGPLKRWDGRAAGRADVYLANSTVTRDLIRRVYGRDATIVTPPSCLDPLGPADKPDGVDPDELFDLCVARLLPYKNVDLVIEAVMRSGRRLVVVGDGPERARLSRLPGYGTRFVLLGKIPDAELRWLYANCSTVVAASLEDLGLSPIESATFGRPTVALRGGGYVDTVVEGVTGLFFDSLDPRVLAATLRQARDFSWDRMAIMNHATKFSRARFAEQVRGVVDGCACP